MASPTLQFKRGLFVNLPELRAGEPGFTTDTSDFYVGGLGENKFFGSHRYWTREDGASAAEFKLVDKDGSNGVSLRAPAEVTTPVTYTLPQGGGTEGYYLKLGASGVLEWSSVSDGASFDDATLTSTTFVGVSTFTGLIDAQEGLEVSGGSTFDDINVTGVGTVGHLEYNSSSTTGISTVGELYVGEDQVLSVDNGSITLSNIQAIDEVTKATLEASLALDPNDFDSLNIAGIATFQDIAYFEQGIDVTGHTELDGTLEVTGVSTFTGAINADGGVVGDLTGNADTATALQTARDFDIIGDFITAAAVSFDGTGNVSLAATITANSIELGTYTSGDYVADISGTANEVIVVSVS